MRGAMVGSTGIRPARLGDLPLLAAVEIDAFATLAEALGVARDARALPRDVLRQSLEENFLLVAVNDRDRPIAFVAGCEIDNTLYVIELDVATAWQRRGIGRRLMHRAIEAARAMGLGAVALTTDRHVAFNAPFYHSLGFEMLVSESMPPFLRNKLDEEIGNGMDPERRIAMALWFGPTGPQ